MQIEVTRHIGWAVFRQREVYIIGKWLHLRARLDKQPNFWMQQNRVLAYLHKPQFFCYCVLAVFPH
jgi:hypothetical protein